jgi:hypothetical protein
VLNRKLDVAATATTLPTVCFGLCDNSCQPIVVATAPITFKVNMNGTTVGAGVFLAGSFNNFSATANPMSQVGTTGVYETTVNIDTTATVTYKFVNGTAFESVTSACGVSDGFGGFNRSLVVPNAAATLPTVCYNLCDNSCQPTVAVTAPITFRVNMSASTIGAGVFLAGSFNNFSATANPMSQVGTTGVYETTVNIDTTATVTYKFVNGTAYESVSSNCGVSDGFGGFNRSLVVPNAATILPTVCYSQCTNCSTTVVSEINSHEISVYPNPAFDKLNIKNSKGAIVYLLDINARELMQLSITNNLETIDFSGIANGLYFVKISSNNQNKIFKIIKE